MSFSSSLPSKRCLAGLVSVAPSGPVGYGGTKNSSHHSSSGTFSYFTLNWIVGFKFMKGSPNAFFFYSPVLAPPPSYSPNEANGSFSYKICLRLMISPRLIYVPSATKFNATFFRLSRLPEAEGPYESSPVS